MNKPISLLMFLAVSALFAGCYRDEPVYTSDLDLVVTNYQKDFAFSTKTTFSLPDSVVLISDENYDGTISYAKPTYGNTILAEIRSNMLANGWVEVDKNANPDVIILPSVSQTTNVFYYYSYSYWSWYYPSSYYPGGWGWYYPGYYFPPTTSTYKTGSVFIQMTDPSNAATSDQLPVVWTAVINGLLEGNTTSIQGRISTSIDQAFKQSSYLKK
jgi:hypothetical protein